MDKKNKRNQQSPDPLALPTRTVILEAYLVKDAEKRARAKGLTLERYIGNMLAVQMEQDPLPDERRKIDEFLDEPGRREWLDSWRLKNALKDSPTMADINAAYKAEDDEIRYETLKEKHQL